MRFKSTPSTYTYRTIWLICYMLLILHLLPFHFLQYIALSHYPHIRLCHFLGRAIISFTPTSPKKTYKDNNQENATNRWTYYDNNHLNISGWVWWGWCATTNSITNSLNSYNLGISCNSISYNISLNSINKLIIKSHVIYSTS